MLKDKYWIVVVLGLIISGVLWYSQQYILYPLDWIVGFMGVMVFAFTIIGSVANLFFTKEELLYQRD